MPDDKKLEILDRKVFGVDGSLLEKQQRKEFDTRKVREQMMGYAKAVIERQDRYDINKKMESFTTEI